MKYLKTAFVIACSLIIGLLAGNLLARRAGMSIIAKLGKSYSKVDELLQYAEQSYVDTLDVQELTEKIMTEFVGKLDPHSAYIPLKDLEKVNSELTGSFSGIGVQFNIQNDTIMIVSVISGGPSQKVGLMAGDRIVSVNDSAFTGKTINNEKVMHTLRGPKGTDVKIGVRRNGTPEILEYTITRGDIPVKSVDIAYMVRPEIGLIRISKFGETTYTEFLNALAELRNAGAKRYIIDLRENTGGYMDQAINMANEFLPAGRLIVYAEGRSYPRYEAHANGIGSFQRVPLVVLIDEFSASASEIFAGAMQDNDRGLIVGRRSFGKGLVQQQLPFSDGSAIRLTVARYYTPSGRCIQKPYEMGKGEEYEMDLLNRYTHGEFSNADSIVIADSTHYQTTNGRIVYGGGGITPDVFVPRDTTGYSPYLIKVTNYAYTYQFAFRYTDKHRAELNKIKTWQEMQAFLNKQDLLEQFVDFAAEKGIKPNWPEINTSRKRLTKSIQAYIIRNILDDEGFYPVFFQDDNTVLEAIRMAESLDGNTIEQNSLTTTNHAAQSLQ